MGGALLSMWGLAFKYVDVAAPAAALIAAALVATYVWRHATKIQQSLIGAVMMGGLVTGGVGFLLGFFGPIIVSPGSPQGPLLGLFFTGPGGFILGAFGGAIYWLMFRETEKVE